MKIFVATNETQGYRANDFCFVPEGEIVMPNFICGQDQSDPDGGCGCGRSLGGVSSFKATTTFRVADIMSTPEGLSVIFYQSMVSGGWLKTMSENMLRAHVKAWVQQVLENAAKFPVGSVVEKRLHVYNLRELSSVEPDPRDIELANLRSENEILKQWIRTEHILKHRQTFYGTTWRNAYDEQQRLHDSMWHAVFGDAPGILQWVIAQAQTDAPEC